MNAVALSGRDGVAPRFAIQTPLDAAAFGPLGAFVVREELAQDLLDLLWTHRVAQHATPGALVRHRLSLQLEQATHFLLAQSCPMRHGTAAILPRQFGQHSDQQKRRPRRLRRSGTRWKQPESFSTSNSNIVPDAKREGRFREEDQYRLERSGLVAIGEYVPGSQLLVGGKLVTSHGLLKHWTGADINTIMKCSSYI